MMKLLAYKVVVEQVENCREENNPKGSNQGNHGVVCTVNFKELFCGIHSQGVVRVDIVKEFRAVQGDALAIFIVFLFMQVFVAAVSCEKL